MATDTSKLTRYTVVNKHGKVVVEQPGRIEPDGVVEFKNGSKWMVIVLRSECERLGLDPATVQASRKPREALGHLGLNPDGLRILPADEYRVEQQATADAAHAPKQAALEAAIPGLAALRTLADRMADDRDDHERGFARMMEDESNDGAAPPQATDASLAAQLKQATAANPRAALYLRAEHQATSGHWSDPTGKSGAARKAMKILAAGGSIEDATAALGERNAIDPGM